MPDLRKVQEGRITLAAVLRIDGVVGVGWGWGQG